MARRYEEKSGHTLRMSNNTFGANQPGAVFSQKGASSAPAADTLHGAFYGEKPAAAPDPSTLSLPAAAVVNPSAHDYHLAPGAAASDAGLPLPEVPDDFDGVRRPQGPADDSGASEFIPR